MKKLYLIATGVILFLGVGHTLLTPMFFSQFSADALWFAGTGLALVFLGFFNLAAARVQAQWIYTYVIPANIILAIYVTAIVAVLPEIQAYLGAFAAWIMAITSIFARSQSNPAIIRSGKG